MKSLRSLVAPIAALIIIIGVVFPIYGGIQEERLNLAFTSIVEADILNNQESRDILKNNIDHMDYLLKHPRQTLKNCMLYEAENPEDSKRELIIMIATKAYTRIADEKLVIDGGSLRESLRKQNLKLYDALTK